ncbi:MAG TPA: HPr family phosphocarrier protein [Actinomycetota bacterium]|nr:HPr family phosphocarrier protein [Actinomycetota bacterium]
MPEATVALLNASGLHARPAKIFARAAAATTADVTVSKDGREVNGKSVLSVLTLDCHEGDQIVIRTEGEGADQALTELVRLVESGLGEAGEG